MRERESLRSCLVWVFLEGLGTGKLLGTTSDRKGQGRKW